MARTVQSLMLDLVSRIDPRSGKMQEIRGTAHAVTITNVTSNGGLIRITAPDHGLETDDQAYISSVGGTTEANNTVSNPAWTVTRISSSVFDLQGSAFINAYTSGGSVVSAMIGTVDSQRFPRQRLMDIYNEARVVVYGVLRGIHGRDMALEMCAGAMQTTTITWTQSGAQSTAPYPSGYIEFDSMHTSADVSMLLLTPEYAQVVRETLSSGFANPDFAQSASKIFIFETASGFTHYGSFVATASTYKIRYLGIVTYAIFSDVVGNSTQESLNEDLYPFILQAAELLANEVGVVKAAQVLTEAMIAGKAA